MQSIYKLKTYAKQFQSDFMPISFGKSYPYFIICSKMKSDCTRLSRVWKFEGHYPLITTGNWAQPKTNP